MGPFNSNETVEINIRFEPPGPVTLSLIVKDSNHAMSDWVDLEINFKGGKSTSFSLLLRFLDHFPLLQRLLDILRWNQI
jgi:hypothetical protein